MHDPERDRPADDRRRTAGESDESWDQWFGRTYGSSKYRRFILIWAIALGIALVALFFSGNSGYLDG